MPASSLTLADPAPYFRRGAALPVGTPRTLIVLGAARGGTSMIAQMLHDLGVFVGEGLGSTFQDAALSEISRALFDRRIDIGHPAIEQVLRSRDRQFAVWGWKFPERFFPELYDRARNPHVVAVFRDPVAIATRESLSGGYNLQASFERASQQLSALHAFVLATPHPCLAVSYERGLAKKAELVDALAAFAGIDAAPDRRRNAVQRAEPGSSAYLADTRAADVEGHIDCVDAQIAGWLRCPHEPERRVEFTAIIDDMLLYSGVADRFREDLRNAFNNDGRCAFSIAIPEHLRDGRRHRVRIGVTAGGRCVIGNNDRDWIITDE